MEPGHKLKEDLIKEDLIKDVEEIFLKKKKSHLLKSTEYSLFSILLWYSKMGVLLQSSGRNFSVQLTEYVVQLVNAQQLLLMFNSNFSKKML